ncbi:MAG TPA: hypothetical protein IGS53_20405 [Leptolyngbyaceae cyanobacterium M33_DOE_097]|uniref:Uncharacterized protein n=1 Tax=Oscillatoriales cyanobacterium SpSt-418 TaxID=2282169 RepID=A0A7C3KFH2_9CYAN|nr:hypothetical protein [Leptolyngbyaceae cyanobacterium M33_DOE_097]
MPGELCWLPKFGVDGQLILHLRQTSHEPWKPYTAFPHLKVPDYRIPGGSKGWATYQKLFKAGWILVPTDVAKRSLVANPVTV